MDAGRWCHAYDLRSEGSGRQINQIGPLGKADGPPGPPMDRNGAIWANAADRLSRLLGVEMTRAEGGPPSPDWHQRNVYLRHLFEPKSWTCVPRIPASVGASYKVAECWSAMRASRVSSTVMVGG
jgi:hypothetical protein